MTFHTMYNIVSKANDITVNFNPRDDMHKPEAIIFDWDNTLVDTNPHIEYARNTTFNKFKTTESVAHEIMSSTPSKQAFFAQFGDKKEESLLFFYEAYKASTINGVEPITEALALILAIKEAGIPMVVVSNKLNTLLNREISFLGWNDHFEAIVGAKDTPYDKPFPHPVNLALSKINIEASNKVWFIGDSTIDIQCALNTNCFPILFGDKSEFDAAQFTKHDIMHFDEHSGLKDFFAKVCK